MGKRKAHHELAMYHIDKINKHLAAMDKEEWGAMTNATDEELAHFRSRMRTNQQAINTLVNAVKGTAEENEG